MERQAPRGLLSLLVENKFSMHGPCPTSSPVRLIVGITGAPGVIYGARLLELLRDHPIETHLVMSKAA